MKIHTKGFRVGEGDKVDLEKWPTKIELGIQVEEAI